jgi:[glutamine synthetase] adenylyltransferase / [glutamine synthetase]-adenylyl-L-tyrosine phosphorylase
VLSWAFRATTLLPDPPTEPQASLEPIAAPGNIPFQDLEKARQNWSRIVRRASPTLASTLPALLAEAPDPDCALMLFDRLVNEGSPETLRLLECDHRLAHYAIVVFSHSQFLGETLLHNPELLVSIVREKSLDRSFTREDFQQRLRQFRLQVVESDVSTVLAGFKRQQYVRILLRDVLEVAELAETTTEISALADALLQGALEEAQAELQRRYGPPQHLDQSGRRQDTPFAVLSLGKLGGNELNYSSDIDLMFIFGDGAEAPGASVSHREYFVRLAQEVTKILSCATPQGPVFRIDLRLRPQGGEGELAISLAQSLRYYATTAHDWELQALIKARHSAGDAALAQQFIHGVRPYVYTEAANFAAIKTALVAREKMQKGRHRQSGEQGSGIDVKIDSGGIRDIEFLVQCLQRVYGGAEPWLRSSGTLFSLHKLHDNRHLNGSEFQELTTAYEFLRTLEHRLQLRRGQQTHRMPVSRLELQILQRAMGRLDSARDQPYEFVTVVRRRMSVVSEIYQRVIYQQQSRNDRETASADFHLRPRAEFSIADHSNRQILERLAGDAPELYEVAIRDDLTPAARKNLFRFFTAALTSSERYAAVLRHRAAILRALAIFDASDYLTQILFRHPEEIASLAAPGEVRSRRGSGYLFESPLGQGRAVDPAFAYLASSAAPYNEKLALLRRHFRHRAFDIGAKDLAEWRDVYASCAETTSAAEDAIAAAFEIAEAPEGLAVMALGRLGGGELDLLSDADLLFVCGETQDHQQLTQAVSRIVQVLTAYTQEGMVFPIDTRLRPRGGEGELLATPTHLVRYFEQEAHAWEALTYTKLRFLAGSRSLGQQANAAAEALFQRFAADRDFARDIREMRQRLEAADCEKTFKTSPGAVYDIDFLSGFLLVQNRIHHKNGTLRDRLWRCAEAGLLEKQDAAALDHGGELLRTVDHAVRLVVGRRCKWLPTTEQARHTTEKLTSEILGRKFHEGLEAELDRTCRATRKIYDRALGVPAG